MLTIQKDWAPFREALAKKKGVKNFPCPPEWEEEWSKCEADPKYFIEKYIKTYDPRREQDDRWVPFILWPKQVEYLDWLKTQYKAQEHCVVCKCRTMGVSWITLCFFLHVWLFETDAKLTLGSYKEEKIDSPGNPDSLFEKARRVLDSLPEWMQPPGWNKRLHDMKLKLVNPWNGSVMSGEAGDNCGTGGRSTAYFMDEFAKVDRSRQVQAAVQDNSRFIVYVSTPEGTANEFARMIEEKEHPVFWFSVYDDPTRNHWETADGRKGNGKDSPEGATYPWIDKERRKRDPINFAQEVMGDLFASMQDAVYLSEWIDAAINFPVEHVGPIVAGLDIGSGAKRMSTVLAIRQGPKLLGLHCTSGVEASKKVFDLMLECEQARDKEGRRIEQVVYDASGDTGADFAEELPNRKFSFTLIPFMGQKGATNRRQDDGTTAAMKYGSMKTEACFTLRHRFRKTYEKKHGLKDHPDHECVSIPNDPELISELRRIQFEPTADGKVRVVSKAKMRAMGLKSPDKADAVAYAFFYEKQEVAISHRYQQ